MPPKNYECMFIFDSNRYTRDPSGVSDRIHEMFNTLGAEVLASRLWVDQKLAYPIKGQRKGAYWLTYCQLDSLKLPELNRACQLNDNILRHLVIKIDPRLIDTLVAHAKGEIAPGPEGDEHGDGQPDGEPASEQAEGKQGDASPTEQPAEAGV